MNRENELDLERLKSSPLFQLSLSSKELFHSNFIYWTINNDSYRGYFEKWFSKQLNLEDRAHIINLKRESKNIDISFEWETADGSSEEVIIELKVKSQPTIKQLNKYSKKFPNAIKVLLTTDDLSEGFEQRIEKVGWQVMKLRELVPFYKKLSETKERYHSELFKDYSLVIELVSTIFEVSKLDGNKQNGFHHETHNEFLASLKQIKMHDLYLKAMYRQMGLLGIEELINNNVRATLDDDDLDSPEINDVLVQHGMTRGQGLVSFKVVKGEAHYVGIQVQGKQFRYFHEKSPSTDDAKELQEKWFEAIESINQNILLPSRSEKSELRYGDSFKYRYWLISNEVEIKDIIALVTKAVQIARELD